MELSSIYKQQLAEATQKGQRIIVECILRVRFGVLDEQLAATVDNVLALPSEEFMPFLLQLSREELLTRFSD
ncbi:MAG: hypothetical protein H0X31_08405 [Nostocaceae cyanobacterium]|nr:hypothetical protein [Nostocaceae cyanobacterium]